MKVPLWFGVTVWTLWILAVMTIGWGILRYTPDITGFDAFIVGMVAGWVAVPSEWDPAIWLKERMEAKRARRD